jgi:hypothetical protein
MKYPWCKLFTTPSGMVMARHIHLDGDDWVDPVDEAEVTWVSNIRYELWAARQVVDAPLIIVAYRAQPLRVIVPEAMPAVWMAIDEMPTEDPVRYKEHVIPLRKLWLNTGDGNFTVVCGYWEGKWYVADGSARCVGRRDYASKEQSTSESAVRQEGDHGGEQGRVATEWRTVIAPASGGSEAVSSEKLEEAFRRFGEAVKKNLEDKLFIPKEKPGGPKEHPEKEVTDGEM